MIVIYFFQSTYNSKDGIPLHAPVFLGREREYVLDTINSTFVSSVGTYVVRAASFQKHVLNIGDRRMGSFVWRKCYSFSFLK